MTIGRVNADRKRWPVDSIAAAIADGEFVVLVGPSGCGKSTLLRMIAGLEDISDGTVAIGDRIVNNLAPKARDISMVFQNYALYPHMTVAENMAFSMTLAGASKAEKAASVQKAAEILDLVPLLERKPRALSGGQRQRIGIARALATQPDLIICDEPVSALDVAVQAQILNLLRKLQADFGLTFLFISHDLGVVQHMCDSIAVMYMGKVVEHADRLSLFNNPLHPYTVALLSAVPSVDKKRREETKRILIPGDPPDPLDLPKGCRFANRCPVAVERCKTEQPELNEVVTGHKVACHLVDERAVSPLT